MDSLRRFPPRSTIMQTNIKLVKFTPGSGVFSLSFIWLSQKQQNKDSKEYSAEGFFLSLATAVKSDRLRPQNTSADAENSCITSAPSPSVDSGTAMFGAA